MTILGSLSPAEFLRRHWQKRPLLVRQAFPGFSGILDREALLSLATRADVTSRLVIQHPRRRQRWERHDGPLGALEPDMLPRTRWTLLVHGLESLVSGGWELLRAFSFIPLARIDDLMVSYAADGGTVGPHVDDYDVFLLQGPGRRRWQISRQRDREVDPDAAIRVLRRFVPEEEWLLEPGDMLYLPPGVAHHGVAEGPCFTYSIGFLAPSHAELLQEFGGYLGQLSAELARGRYADPDLRPARDPARIGDAMVAQVATVLRQMRWGRAEIEDFVGRLLTRPRRRFVAQPIPIATFRRRLRGRGRLAMALPSRGLLRGGRLFLNGDARPLRGRTRTLLERLVRERALLLPIAAEGAAAILHEWYEAGWVTFA